VSELKELRNAKLSVLEGRIGKEGVTAHDLPTEEKVGFAFDLLLKVAQDNAVFLLNGCGQIVAVEEADFGIDLVAACTEYGTLPGQPFDKFPRLLRVLHFHENREKTNKVFVFNMM